MATAVGFRVRFGLDAVSWEVRGPVHPRRTDYAAFMIRRGRGYGAFSGDGALEQALRTFTAGLLNHARVVLV
jgi:hypothetical protein